MDAERCELTAPPNTEPEFLLFSILHAVHQIFPGTFRYVMEKNEDCSIYFTCWRYGPDEENRPKTLSPEATRKDLESYLEKIRLLRETSDDGSPDYLVHQSCE